MKPRGLRVVALSTLVLAGTATAASSPVTATVTPNTPGAATQITISIAGALPPGLPSALEFTAQPGFTGSIKSVTALCTSAEAAGDQCPSASDVGTGSVVTNSLGTIPLTLALGAPSQSGDIASVFLVGKVGASTLVVNGRYFAPSGGGLELLISQFPQLPIPGLQITSLSLTAKAVQTVKTPTVKKVKVTTGKGKNKKTKIKKVTTYTTSTDSLITNPTTCPSSGMWTGSVVATFASTGPQTLPFTTTCSAGSSS